MTYVPSFLRLYLSLLTESIHIIKVCKYHDKTKRRKTLLSSTEYAGTQVDTTTSNQDDGDDEYGNHRVPALAQKVTLNQYNNARASGSGSSEWKKNLPLGGSSNITASSYGKRPSSISSNGEHASNKRPKVSYAPALGEFQTLPVAVAIAIYNILTTYHPLHK